MQGLNKYRDNGIHGYIFMVSMGIIFGAFAEGYYLERVTFAASVIMGINFAVIHKLNRSLRDEPIYTRALISSFVITAIEFVFGIITNRIMDLRLWDFSDSFFHILGQICPKESFIRFLIAFPVIFLSRSADRIPIKVTGDNNGEKDKQKV